MERDCKTCVYSAPSNGIDNGCTAWECEYINKKEAIKAWKEMQRIVRCKDCRWYNCKACFKDESAQNHRDPDDFCSRGERK